MIIIRKISILVWLLIAMASISNLAVAQENKVDSNIIEFSGFVITADSASPIPYANVEVINTGRGTATNLEGFYSLAVKENDTLIFKSTGFKQDTFSLHDNIRKGKLTHVQTLELDTIAFQETVVEPLPSNQKFREAFLNLDLPSDKFKLAKKNLDSKKLDKISESLSADALENYNYTIQQFHDEAFYNGANRPFYTSPSSETPIPGSLLNPLAWSKFIKSIKKGEFGK